jgi:hypothetical protein
MRLKPVKPNSLEQQRQHSSARNLPGGIESHQPVGFRGNECLYPETRYGWCKR